MAKILATILSLATFCLLLPSPTFATDPAVEVLQQNLAVSYQPPQASAEALLNLPSVYVLPGSFLYWFKHVVEEIQLAFTADLEDRSNLLIQFSQRRLAEGYQAINKKDWDAATASFKEYQQTQDELSSLLADLQDKKVDIKNLLEQLKHQLGVQQAIDQFSKKNAPKDQANTISQLLKIRPVQTLALAVYEDGALLGSQDERQQQATTSAQATGSAQASESAQASTSAEAE